MAIGNRQVIAMEPFGKVAPFFQHPFWKTKKVKHKREYFPQIPFNMLQTHWLKQALKQTPVPPQPVVPFLNVHLILNSLHSTSQ